MKRSIRTIYFILISLFVLAIPYAVTLRAPSNSDSHSLNIFTWGNYIPTEVFTSFEEETGIKIHLHYCMSNEEMLLKLQNREGDYDIIFPSDYGVKILREHGLVKHLDKSRLNFLETIDSRLVNHPFDPNNQYSIPYTYETYGLAYDTNVYPGLENPTLSDYFSLNVSKENRVVMAADPLDGVSFIAHHLFGDKEILTYDEQVQLIDYLHKMAPYIEAYADFRASYYLISKTSSMALVKSSFIPALALEAPDVKFRYLQEGLFTSLESAAICSTSKNVDGAYAFLNHLYKPENIAKQIELYPYYTACPEALNLLPDQDTAYLKHFRKLQARNDFIFFHFYMTEEKTREIWMRSKVL